MVEKEEYLYTHKQLCEMMSICRSHTLNNPNAGLPHIPVAAYVAKTDERGTYFTIPENAQSDMPNYKKAHWLLRLLFKKVK